MYSPCVNLVLGDDGPTEYTWLREEEDMPKLTLFLESSEIP